MGDKLDINNLTENDITIQGQVIAASGNYTVPDADIVTWSKDAYLRFLITMGSIDITVFGQELPSGQGSLADMWLNRVAQGLVIYS